MKRWIKKEGRVWLSSHQWSEMRTVYEYFQPVRGLTLWGHLMFVDDPNSWVVSEASSGLRITERCAPSKDDALAAAILRMEPYSDKFLAATVKSEIVKQVTHLIQGDSNESNGTG